MQKKAVKTNKHKRKKQRYLIAFILVAVVLAITAALSFTVFFPVSQIKVSGGNVYSTSDIINASQIKNGDNLLLINNDTVYKNIKSALPYIESVKISKSLPDTVTITVTDAYEKYCFQINDSYFTADKDFYILEQYDSFKDGAIKILCECHINNAAPKSIVIDDKTNKKILDEIIYFCQEQNIILNKIDIKDTAALNIVVDNRFSVDLGEYYDLKGKLNHLKGMMASIDTTKAGKINLSGWSSEKPTGYFVENSANSQE